MYFFFNHRSGMPPRKIKRYKPTYKRHGFRKRVKCSTDTSSSFDNSTRSKSTESSDSDLIIEEELLYDDNCSLKVSSFRPQMTSSPIPFDASSDINTDSPSHSVSDEDIDNIDALYDGSEVLVLA